MRRHWKRSSLRSEVPSGCFATPLSGGADYRQASTPEIRAAVGKYSARPWTRSRETRSASSGRTRTRILNAEELPDGDRRRRVQPLFLVVRSRTAHSVKHEAEDEQREKRETQGIFVHSQSPTPSLHGSWRIFACAEPRVTIHFFRFVRRL